jgi:uncharacterized damage-inducible protein DinB
MFPPLLERLRGTPARIEDRIADLSGQTLVRRDGGRWSIQENIGHLLDLEPLWYGRVDDLSGGKDVLRPADLENRKTHEADHNAASPLELTLAFRRARFQLVERLDGVDAGAVERSARHPRLDQPMRLIDLVFFVAEHDDHHLATITDLVHLFGE